ncbi:MAG: hypothetical protein IJR38_10265 [Selenomonadaceae bacterium]|nr:hypothetical protein [Selenomonadaceae bacterium]
MSEVEDKLLSGSFTERAKTDGIDIGKQTASDKRELPGRPGPQPRCGAKREFSFRRLSATEARKFRQRLW